MEKIFEKFRSNFTSIEDGIYLNHAAVSPMSLFHKRAMEEYYIKRSRFPVDLWPDAMNFKLELKQKIKKVINASSVNEIAITLNTSMGLSLFASGYPWKYGDEIIIHSIEFPANVYPFMNLETRGVRIKWIKIQPDQGISLEEIKKHVTDKTRAIAISFVQFINGFRADLHQLGHFCRQKDILLVVDGIQGVGVMPIDVQKMNIDVLAVGGHKWLMWPMGVGFVYIRNGILENVRPSLAGWLSVKDSWNFFDYKLDFLDSGEKFEFGTLNYMGIYVANTLLGKFLEMGIPNIYRKILHLTNLLIEGLRQMGLKVISSLEEKHRSGIITIKLKDSERIYQKLKEEGVIISLRAGMLRFSPHCYNTEEEIHRALDILQSALSF